MRKTFASCDRDGGRPRTRGTLALAVLVVCSAAGAGAQVVPGDGAAIGSVAADRARVLQITGHAADTTPAPPTPAGIRTLPSAVIVTWNSALPNGGNDGQLWAGRGLNASVTSGVGYTRRVGDRTVDVVLAPTLSYSENSTFFVFPGLAPGRSAFSSPWHADRASADLPLRFGDQPIRMVGFGQSAVTVTADGVAFGASTSNEWWGPAMRNTLILGNNAAGIPRLFVRTTRPVRTRFGTVEGRMFVGGLTESPFFDQDPANDTRSASALLVTFRPNADTGLTLGVSRLVMAPARSPFAVPLHALDVLLRWEPVRAYESGPTPDDPPKQGSDQLLSLFARWVLPASGVEAYAEWARMELPRSIREFLDVPQSTQGYTLGMQWAAPRRRTSYLRLMGEITYLEQTQVIAGRRPPDFYTGVAAVQGFTQRGQLLGAPIGPGSSTQFLGGDYMAAGWQVGAFVGRTRTENDALYRALGTRPERHDVTVFSGVRGAVRLPKSDLAAELTVGRRMNYLFQSDYSLVEGPVVATDIQNVTLSFTVSPR